MREVHEILREAPLASPTPQLHARVQEALARAESRGRQWFHIPVPLWACVLAAVACGVLGVMGHAAFTPPPPRVVYILPAEGELRRLLAGGEERAAHEAEAWHVTVTTPSKKRL